MKYLSLNNCDVSNGPGFRVSLFVSGCHFKCNGCWNPRSWNPQNGNEYTSETEDEILSALDQPYISGFSLLGGEPLETYNLESVKSLLKRVQKPVWMWTGFTFESLLDDDLRRPVLDYVDILIDGQYIQEQRDLTLQWRGSRNQRVINVREVFDSSAESVLTSSHDIP